MPAKKTSEDFWASTVKTDTCWLWNGPMLKSGYGKCGDYAHRFAYELLVGPIPKGKCVCHHCDVRNCVNPEHLFIGSQGDNIRDAAAKGRMAKSIEHRAKIGAAHKGMILGPLSDECKRKISLALKGRPLTQSHCNALKMAWRRGAYANRKPISLEDRKKRSETQKRI